MADLTYENALKAMRIAHDKGDMAAAKKMARLAKSLKDGGGAKHPLMSQLNKGIAETAGGIVDFINPFDKPHALNPFQEGTGSAATGIENAMQAAGVEVAQGAPEGMAQGFMRGSGQAAGAIIPTTAGMQMLGSAGGVVGQFADDAYKAMTTRLGPIADVFAGGVSGGAEELAEEAGAPEWVQNTAAVAAPMSIPAAVGTMKAATKISPIGAATRRVAGELAPYTKSGAKNVATRRMQALAGGTDRAEDLARRIDPDNPLSLTPAQQTGDPNMLAVEKLAASQDPNLDDAITARRAASSDLAKGHIDDMGGDVASAQEWFAKRRRNYAKILQAQADGAMSVADDRLKGIRGAKSETENSLIVSEQIRKRLDSALLREKALWDAVDQGEIVGTAIAKSRAQELIDKTPFAQRNDIPRAVNDILNNPEIYGDQATVREMYGAYSELRRVARSAMAGNDQNKNMARIANDVADAILEDLGAKAATSKVGQQINNARAYSAALHETFDRGAPGRLLKRTLDGDTAIDPELALRRTVGRGGAEAAVTSRQIEEAGGEVASGAVEDYIADQFSAHAVSSGTGEVTMPKARSFMAKNRELLDRYPELRGEIEGAVAQRETAEQLSNRITRRIAALENAKRSAVARFVGGSGEKAVSAVINDPNPIQVARRLANEARKDASGEALAGVKGAFSDHLINASLRTKGADTILDASALNTALNDPKLSRAMAQIFDEGELSRLRFIGRELAKAQATTGANIGEDLSGAKANRLIEAIARIGAARHGAKLGGGSGGSIQTAHMASSRVRDMLNNLASDKASQMIADAVTDPELFRALLTQTGSAKSLERAIPRFIPYLVGGATVAVNQ